MVPAKKTLVSGHWNEMRPCLAENLRSVVDIFFLLSPLFASVMTALQSGGFLLLVGFLLCVPCHQLLFCHFRKKKKEKKNNF
jgi:hypothetical protein